MNDAEGVGILKIEHLYYLREIANSKSISSAAKRLYIGQTTLSAIIKSIEEELDIRIFLRTSSGVVPTPDGVRFLAMAEDVIASYSSMMQSFHVNSDPEKRVHFIGDPTICGYFSVFLTRVLQEYNNEASIVFHEADRKKILTEILDGVANIGSSTMDDVEIDDIKEQAARNGLEVTLIGEDKFYLCIRSNYEKFVGRTSVDISELMEERYAAPRHYSSVSNGTAFSDAFRRLNCVATFPNPELVKQAVLGCDMITILSGRCLVNDPLILSGLLVAIPLTGFSVRNSTGVYLYSRKRSSLSLYEKVVYDTIMENSAHMLNPLEKTASGKEQYPPLGSLLNL